MEAIDVKDTPYLIDGRAASAVGVALSDLEAHAGVIRASGRLSEQTLNLYYGQTRFDQIAESNADDRCHGASLV